MQRYDNFLYLQNISAKNYAFSRFFLKIIGFSYIFTQIAISTLQNNGLNVGLLCDYICFSYLRTFAARKIIFAAVFYNVVCARTLYIGKHLKRFYLMLAAFFRLRCMFVLSFVFGTFAAAYLIRFQLSRLFLNKVYPFAAALCSVFLFGLFLN